jgi:uncharacterized protein YbaP (TraB family)
LRLRDWFSRLTAACGGLALLGAAPAPAPQPASQPVATVPHGHPAMWKLTDDDTTIYLFGTIHLLPPGQTWHTPALDAALASSGELVLEIANIDDPQALTQSMTKLGTAEGLPPLAERVPADKRAALAATLASIGLPPNALDRFRTWAAGIALLQVQLLKIGLDPSSGPELSLIGPARAAGKKIEGLETIDDQFGLFVHLSEESQRALLVDALESPDQAKRELQAMLQAWANGDVAGVARTFDGETAISPELRKALMTDRNARWADWLKARMGKPGTVFVAVGAGHLAGKDSVENMLAAKGLKVTRVQ